MLTLTKHLSALVLSMCFLLVTGGLAYTTPLDSHLGHHDQQTHGKTWCSWTCQAGQAIQPLSPHIPRAFALLSFLVPFKPVHRIWFALTIVLPAPRPVFPSPKLVIRSIGSSH